MTTLRLNQTVTRTSPIGDISQFIITSLLELAYHNDFLTRGYPYTVVSAPEYDFDLPEVSGGLRIHRKPFAECESCSA